MVMESFRDVNTYLNEGAEKLVADILRSTLRNPRETAFINRFHKHQKQMEKRREALEAQGQHIPMFLISSITSACNLSCKGCYARANGMCGEKASGELLSADEWDGIFSQAEEAGISFVLLAGGEPLLRLDVLDKAAGHEGIVFPIFTNGTLLDRDAIHMLNDHRNLVPVISLEGGQFATDDRRGEGIYDLTQENFRDLNDQKLLFGVSLTVTTENIAEVTSETYLRGLYDLGCRLVFFIEYVPVAKGTEHLAPGDKERRLLEKTQDALRERFPAMIFLSFPGDEKYMGGCLAAGRGFFHINPYGGAEPCPFSPFSDISLKDHTLMQALSSPFFQRVRELNAKETDHQGGCALFAREAHVKSLLFPAGA
jgi:MoaA/NifB/PqqE/SkfB family radical SAM enzyme